MKLTFKELEELLAQRDKESMGVELKSFEKLFKINDETRKDIATEIVAFANRQGGKLIFGVRDDGTFDGKLKENLDIIKGKIDDIFRTVISPVVECTMQFLEEDEYDALVVFVPKRTTIPHAYVKRGSAEIGGRSYYIRTSHGKKPVTDQQLEWLFKNDSDPAFSHHFRTCFEFDKRLNLLHGILPLGNYSISHFVQYMSMDDLILLSRDSDKFSRFFIKLFPFFILQSLSDFFSESWYIRIESGFDRMSSGAILPLQPSRKISISTITTTGSFDIEGLSSDFSAIFNQLFTRELHIPAGTEMSIDYKERNTACSILLKNAAFSLEILIGRLSSGAGLNQKGHRYEILSGRNMADLQEYSFDNFNHFDGGGLLRASFNFPEYDMTEFDKYYHYFNSLKQLIDSFWNFDEERKKHPAKEILIIDDKLSEVLEILRTNENTTNPY